MKYRIFKNFPDLHRLERDIYIAKTNDKQAEQPKSEASNSIAPPEAAGLSATEGQ